jgi:integrase
MGKDLATREQADDLAIRQEVGQAANHAAARVAFADYRSRKSRHTIRRQDAALDKFSEYLAEANGGDAPSGDALASDPEAWRGITWGLVEGFVKWLLLEGYAVSTVNVRLSTIKTYAKLAAKAGTLNKEELMMIRAVESYSRKEAKRVNEKREAMGIPTRVGDKKAEARVLTKSEIGALEAQCNPGTPQGRRDAVLIGLMLDLGLRVGEVAGLAVGNVNLEAGQVSFYRPKVDKWQTHNLNGLLPAMQRYIERDALAAGPLLRASVSKRAGVEAWHAGQLSHAGMSERAITERVRVLGEAADIEGLSAHDLRHTWATRLARGGTPIDRLQDAGGWASPAMPLRYVEAAKVANEGVKFG